MQKYNGQPIRQFASSVSGNAASGVTVLVRNKSNGATATLYTDNDVSGGTLPNPLTTTSTGSFGFYAADGVYDLIFSDTTPTQVIQLQDVAELQAQFDAAVLNAGYIPSGTFSAGATLTQANQVLSDGSSYWRWDGSLPKTVTAGSAPTPTGVGGWFVISDFALRGDLADSNSTVLIAGVQASVIASKYPTIEDFGAIGDGSTDNTTAITNALAAHDEVYIPSGVFVCRAISLSSGKSIYGCGEKSVLLFKSGETGVFIDCLAGARIANVRVSGGSLPSQVGTSTEGNRTGVKSACLNGNLYNLTIDSFSQFGMYLLDTTYIRQTHTDTQSIKIKNCYIGAKISAEYLLHSNMDVTGCRYGIYLNAGNNSLSNCKIHENYYGFYLTYGVGNEGHGNLNSSMINHNTIGIHCSSIGIGFNFVGNQFFEGKIEIIDCQGIHISNCELDATEYYFSGSGRNVISHNVMIQGYANTITHNSDGTVFLQNYTKTGAVFAGDRSNVAAQKVYHAPYIYNQYETTYLDPSPDGHFYLLSNQTSSGTGALYLQAGAGSGAFGGGVVMYGASHASKAGDVAIGVNGKFRVNANGTDTASNLFTVDASGNSSSLGSTQVGFNSATASAANAGAIRYSSSGSSSVVEMSMKTGASSYAWVVIKSNSW